MRPRCAVRSRVSSLRVPPARHYRLDKPSASIFGGTAGLTPDGLNYGWRDYGPRVGI